MAKFLDLEIFDKKFKMAKEESAATKISLKKLEGQDFEEQIELIKKDIFRSELGIETNKSMCHSIKDELIELNTNLSSLKAKIEAVPTDIIDPVLTKKEISRKERLILETTSNKTKKQKLLKYIN